jgi:hypothetical protein
VNPFHFLKKHQNRCTLIHSSAICGFYTFLTMLSMDMESPHMSPPPPGSSFGPSDGGGGGLERSAVPGRLSGSFKGTEA